MAFIHKKRGIKLLLLSCTFLFILSEAMAYSSNNSYMKAETIQIDDGPSGEKIIDIEEGSYGQSFYALTENGEVYAWGNNVTGQLGNGEASSTPTTIPKKMLNAEGEEGEYLTDVKKIFAGGYFATGTDYAGGSAFMLKNDGTLYAVGSNRYGNLGLPKSSSIYNKIPIKLPINLKIKDISIGFSNTAILTEDGEVYTTGRNHRGATLGHGSDLGISYEFKKIEKDASGGDLKKIKEIVCTDKALYLLSEEGEIYANGDGTYTGTGDYSQTLAPKPGILKDGTQLQVESIYQYSINGNIVVKGKDGILYTSVSASIQYYTPVSSLQTFETEAMDLFLTHDFVTPFRGVMALDTNGVIYNLENITDFGIWLLSKNKIKFPQYEEGELLQGYDNTQKALQESIGYPNALILSKNGGVYLNGQKQTFGSVTVKGSKKLDNTPYYSARKYNGDVILNLEVVDNLQGQITYSVTDLQTGISEENKLLQGNSIEIVIEEGQRFNKKYTFYLTVNDELTQSTFIVDLYKQKPSLNEIKDGATYDVGKSFSFDYNGFTQNAVSAELIKDTNESVSYTSGTPITETGQYTLNIMDLYGNTNHYSFTVSEHSTIESIDFIPTDSEKLFVGSDITRIGDIIGILELKYSEGADTFDIAEAIVESDQFTIINKNELKVINTNLSAGDYELEVTGTDTNGMDFSGRITITIAKASQTMDWNDETKAWKDSGITKNDTITVGVKNVLENAAVTYGIKGTNSCVSVNPMTGALSISCVPEDKKVTMTARSEATTSYDTKTIEITLPFQHEYTALEVDVTSEGTAYTGEWTKHDVTFTVSGGLSEDELEGYEYAITDGTKPNTSTTWNAMTNDTLALTNNINDKTYWFRALPSNNKAPISKGFKVNLDVDIPTVPTMTMEEINHSRIAQFINLFSFGSWMNKEAKVTMISTDTTSGIDHYEYMEDSTTKQSTTGILTYGDGAELSLKARACDKAGNCSSYSDSETIQIDMKAPTITGVKNQAEYKQYYLPRFFKVEDGGSGVAKAEYMYENGTPVDITTATTEIKVTEEGAYQIKAKDHAGNEVTLTFKIVKLPNIETEIDGSDESKEIIDQIQKEYDEVKDKLDQTEKNDIEKWIKDATEKWEKSRNKVIEDDETSSKVEGQGDTSFDPKTELIVEELLESDIPQLPKKALNIYDVYLKKGNTVIQPDGSIKVYLPYKEDADPIVYEIDEDGKVKEIPVSKEDGYVTFVTDTLMKYAISDSKQEDIEKEVCVVGPDSEEDTKDDVCGEGNEAGEEPVKKPNGDVEIPDGGSVIFPGGNEVELPDGGILHPDGSVTLPDGTELSPEGDLIDKPDEPDSPAEDPEGNKKPTEPDQKEPICTAGPDGKLGTSDDVCGEGNDKGEEPSKKPNGDVEVPGGGSIIFPGGNEVELPDGGTIHPDGSVTLPDGTQLDPNGNQKDPDVDMDSDKDGKPDVNVDVDCDTEGGQGSGKADINIDTDGDGIPDINIDTTGDGKPNYNIDINNDGKPDVNVGAANRPWKPDLCQMGTCKEYCTDSFYDPYLNIDTDGDGRPDINLDLNGDMDADINIDVDGDHIPDVNIDTTGDGKPDINIDDDGDGIADRNLLKLTEWKPNKDVNGRIKYDTMSGLKPDPTLNQGTNQNGTSNGDKQTSVMGTYQGGANTGDATKPSFWWIIVILNGSVTGYLCYRRRRRNKN